MISFAPWHEYLFEHGIQKTEFYDKIGIARSTGVKLFKNGLVNLSIVDDICREYNVTVEQVIKYVSDPDGTVRKDRSRKKNDDIEDASEKVEQ